MIESLAKLGIENLPNNLRDTVAQLEGIELRRPQNLYMHLT